jgi:beta-glucosidase
MSDWMGTYSTVNCMNAGMDLEMPGPTKWRGELLEEAVSTGAVSEETVTKSARRVLELLQKLGRFEDPSEPPELEVENPRRNEIIAQTGADGMVLLKNDGGLLPISRERSTSVAMIGHHASLASLGGGGSARVDAIHSVTPIEGLRHLGFDVRTSPGVPVYATLPHPNHDIVFPPGQRVHTDCPVRVEWFNGSKVGHNRVLEEWKPTAEYMVKEKWPSFLDHDYCTRMSYDVRPTSGGDHVVSVITTGRAVLCINGETVFERAQPTDMAMEQFYFYKSKLEQRLTYHMEAQQQYTLSLETWATDPDILNGPPLFGKFYQGASLRFQEHIDVRRRLQDAANVASNANIAIVCVGTTNEIESDGFDRTTLALAGEQYELIRAVSQVNPKTVVVNFSGAPVSMIEFVDTVPAIVHASFPGQECGHSLARVLTGITNPSGRLPFSWPRAIQDNPSYGNFPVGKDMKLHYPEGLDVGYRHYLRAESSEPLFPFGFGLSYTDFEISNLRAGSAGVIPAGPQGAIDIFCDVQNIGQERTGRCVVQLYVSLPATKIGRRRPIRELAGFYKIELRPLEKKTVRLSLDKYSTSIYDESVSRWRGLRGEFKVYTGISSVDVAHEILVVRDDEFTWTGV